MQYTIRGALVAQAQGYETVDVQIEGDRISAIAAYLEPIGTVIEANQKLLLPGFVNAHTHSSEMWQRGLISPLPLELWLAELYDSKFKPEQIYLSALHTAAETLLSGGTCVVDHLPLIPGQEMETIAAAVSAYRDIGIRAFVAPLIQDKTLPASVPTGGHEMQYEPYLHSAEETLAMLQQAVEKFHQPEAGIYLMVAPTGAQLCSDDMLEGCVEFSDRHSLCRHTHLLESRAQKLLAEEQYGCSAVEYLKRLGFLGARTSLAHCVWLNDDDITLLAATRSTVVHNPLSNLRLGSGIAPLLQYRQAGVNVSFGCDGAASNDSQDLLEAIKIGSILHNVTDFDYRHWITPRQAIEMASLGGATGLGLAEELGTLTVGKKADLVLYDLTNLSLLPRTDPIGLLVLGRPTQAVDCAWVNGKQTIAQGKLTTIDVDTLRQNLLEQSQYHQPPSKTLQQMEPHYRSVMGLR
ncbi:amidohydrolase [Phormidium tenue FACHB-886]|nr:amidohydrolase [Phormidium tenue FACHB-886]